MLPLAAVLRRDLALALGRRGGAVGLLAFFVLAALLFPFGMGPDAADLAPAAPGLLWVIALLAAFLGADRLFHADYEDGTLDLLVSGPVPLPVLALVRVFAHWLVTGLPRVALAPVAGILLALPSGHGTLALAMLLGTPSLALIGALGASLTLGAARGGVLTGLLVLPLYIPVLIFGVAAVDAAILGRDPAPFLQVLGALFLGALVLAPAAVAAAWRQALR